MKPSLRLAVVLSILASLAASSHAAGPDATAPGQSPTVRIEPQVPSAPEQRIDCVGNPTDPRCRENACAGQAEIYGYDTRTCTPCLPNSLADFTNRRCACVAGFVEVSSDSWGRVTCERAGAAPPQAQPAMQDVSVEADDFYRLSEEQGFGHSIVSVPFGNTCTVSLQPQAIRIEYFPPETSLIAPAPYDVEDRSCLVRLFGSQLQNGWTFVGVNPFSTQYCDHNQDYGVEVEKRHANPVDTVVDVRVSAWGSTFCHIQIGAVTLNGPAGEHWKRAFGH